MGLKPLHAHPLGKVNIKPILLRQQTQDGQLNQSGLSGPGPHWNFTSEKPSSPLARARNLSYAVLASSGTSPAAFSGNFPSPQAFLRRVKRCYPPKIPILLSVSGQGGHGMGAGPWLIGSDFNVEAHLLGSEVHRGPYGGVVESVLSESLPETGKVIKFENFSFSHSGPHIVYTNNFTFKKLKKKNLLFQKLLPSWLALII
ncbi:hypothetical protein M9H77_17941 [Catharanthus roseus]|uniref:Uncharacterized protein n=1 Tax=Catharanthus roseus TaxID=4058 RepID=A0ACC0B616_CATRO|nr:hypothetical protein M9H77_17941 [Catharanthus roseus]